MPFEPVPDDLIALRFPIGEDEDPISRIALPEQESVLGPAFRQGNFIVSAIASGTKRYKPEPKYSPLNDIADTHYLLEHGDEFIGSRSHLETKSIMAKIDRELKDREILAAGGWYGTVAGIGAGILDPLNLAPGGAFYKGARVMGKAASLAMAAGVGTAVQETGLHATQHTRTMEESIWNIGGATVLGSLLDVGSSVDRGPVVEVAAQWVQDGRIEAAQAHFDSYALSRRADLIAAARAHDLPAGEALMPMVGNCLTPQLADGDMVAVEPFGHVLPGDIMVFAGKDEPFHYAKVFLGVSNCDALCKALNHDRPGPCAVLWMANPESFLLVSLASLAYVARVTGRVDSANGFEEFSEWPFTEEHQEAIEHFRDSIEPRSLACFGNPPLALVAA